MNTVAALRQYAAEYRTILRAMQLLLDAPADALAPRDLSPQLELLGVQVLHAFVHVTERLYRQVREQQLRLDLVVATLLHEGCDRMAALSVRFAAGSGCLAQVTQDAAELARRADVLFQKACRGNLMPSA